MRVRKVDATTTGSPVGIPDGSPNATAAALNLIPITFLTFSSPTFICRVAGTAGAIVTCPLEVVKTRLQSSSSGFYPPPMNKELTSGHVTCKGFPKPEQRRRLCTGGYTR